MRIRHPPSLMSWLFRTLTCPLFLLVLLFREGSGWKPCVYQSSRQLLTFNITQRLSSLYLDQACRRLCAIDRAAGSGFVVGVGGLSCVLSLDQQHLWPLPGLPRWCSGKESACRRRSCRRHKFDPWVGKIPWSRKWQPAPVFLPGKFHGKRRLVGESSWGHPPGFPHPVTGALLPSQMIPENVSRCCQVSPGRGGKIGPS